MGGNKERRGIYHGDREWREETGFSWFPKDRFMSTDWHSSKEDGLSFKLIDKISERVNFLPEEQLRFGSATAVFVADELSSRASQATDKRVIVKVHMRIPYVPLRAGRQYVSTKDLHSHHLPIDEEYPDEPAYHYGSEVKSLQHLTDHKCAHTPSLLATFQHYEANPWVKNGFIGFIVMTKLPAVPVADIWEYAPNSQTLVLEQLCMQEALKVALVSVDNLAVGPLDEAARNVMWDSKAKKCYIVDFEMTVIEESLKHQTWEDYTRFDRTPFSTFARWDMIMKDQQKILFKILYPHQT